MRKNYIVMLVAFIMFGVFTNSMYSYVESQIEGVIADDETGQPLKGAEVGLYQINIRSQNSVYYTLQAPAYIKTNSKGKFKFRDLRKAIYFIAVFKNGYSAIGPFSFKKPKMWEDNNGQISSLNDVNSFTLKEGRIKHFKIRLEKEAILKIKVLKKTFDGISPILNPNTRLNIKHSDFYECNEYEEDPTSEFYITKNFKKGSVDISIETDGYATKKYFKNILLKSGEITTISHTFDFTKDQVVYGRITDKNTGKPIEEVDISFSTKLGKVDEFFMTMVTDMNGIYRFANFESGLYKLRIFYIDNNGDMKFDYQKMITIKKNQVIKIDKQF